MTKTALVTGASRGIGKAIAATLALSDFDVITPKRDELDLASRDSIRSFLAGLGGGVDVLVNNAGINPLASTLEIGEEDMDEALAVNMVAPILLMQGVLPGMIARRYGRIVNISSIWSAVTKPRRLIYAATKAALNGLTRTTAVEVAEYNILVNAVAPGFVNTELTRQNNTPEEIRKIAACLPVGRLADPEEIAQLVLFLVSERNTFMTGQTLFIDGGYSCL